MQKVVPDAPHDVMLVLDGSTGQNAFEQAKQFTKATQVSSLAITKLDDDVRLVVADQYVIHGLFLLFHPCAIIIPLQFLR